jgi:hypothetical protein
MTLEPSGWRPGSRRGTVLRCDCIANGLHKPRAGGRGRGLRCGKEAKPENCLCIAQAPMRGLRALLDENLAGKLPQPLHPGKYFLFLALELRLRDQCRIKHVLQLFDLYLRVIFCDRRGRLDPLGS